MRATADGDASAPPVRVEVLGPLRLLVGGLEVAVPGPKRRALLALLAMADSRVMALGDLLDALWPSGVPDSARATLQSHISRLRRHLGGAASRLEGVEGGYRLRLGDTGAAGSGAAGVDAVEAGDLLAAASAAGSSPADRRRLLASAQALWRGEPLVEFVEVAPLQAWAVALGTLRRAIDEAHVVAVLDDGDVPAALQLASALAAADPQAEPGALLHMRALRAGGRAGEALRLGHDFRRRLAEETGLHPSPALGDLEREIAAAAAPAAPRLPRPDSRLHGRDSELAAVHRLLERQRLVTLVGSGGVGKTRLAVEVAARRDGDVVMLALAPVTEPRAIARALGDALDLREVHGDVLGACTALLAAGPQLLVMDNCEHLLPDVADMVARLLAACPELAVLATSREPLGLPDEQRLRVAPLPVTRPAPPHGLAGSPAAAVFVDQARRVLPDFDPDAGAMTLIGDIVRRLDGVPLAIQLAAGRLSSLGLADLHARLDRALDLLGDGGRTLRQAIAWSYDLLPPEGQLLFRHLTVFPDGFAVAAAEFVARDVGVEGDAVDGLVRLVDASMVELVQGDPVRYRILDTLRAFGRDQLEATGETAAAADLFVRWAVDLGARIETAAGDEGEPTADRHLRRELGNLRAAWSHCREQHRLDDAVALVAGMANAAGWRDLTEIWDWSLELVEDPAIVRHPMAALVYGQAADGAWARGELDRAADLAAAGLAVGGEGSGSCMGVEALIALSRGVFDRAETRALEAAAATPRPDQSLGIAALAAAYSGAVGRARAHGAALAAVAGYPTLDAFSRYVTAEIEAVAGDFDRAETLYEQAVALSRVSGATFVEGVASVGLMTARVHAGRVPEALTGYLDLIDYWERTGGWVQQWVTLDNLARLLRRLGDAEAASVLDAAAAPASTATRVDRVRVLTVARDAIARALDSA